MHIDLSLIWFFILLFSVLMYVVLDGFDLGIGMLYLTTSEPTHRNIMMQSIAPVWDGNETWLVLGGAALFGAFPLAYALFLDQLAIPITIMVLALIFRGVAFEFRFSAFAKRKIYWDSAFLFGSILSAFMQGVIVGNVVQGFDYLNTKAATSFLPWLSLFSIYCGIALCLTYSLLGCCWLIIKTLPPLQSKMYKAANFLFSAQIINIIIVMVWSFYINPSLYQPFLIKPNIYLFFPAIILLFFLSFIFFLAINKKWQHLPFISSLFIIFIGFSGLVFSLYPYIIPPILSIKEASSTDETLLFMLVGTCVILPIILIYSGWNYYIFKGKVTKTTHHY